jgi:peptide/nickel transport system permease protein
MPAIALGWLLSASHIRFVRSSILDSLDTDSVKMARVKGLPPRLVIWKHALKNAAIPVFTLFAVNFAHLPWRRGHRDPLPATHRLPHS